MVVVVLGPRVDTHAVKQEAALETGACVLLAVSPSAAGRGPAHTTNCCMHCDRYQQHLCLDRDSGYVCAHCKQLTAAQTESCHHPCCSCGFPSAMLSFHALQRQGMLDADAGCQRQATAAMLCLQTSVGFKSGVEGLRLLAAASSGLGAAHHLAAVTFEPGCCDPRGQHATRMTDSC